MTREENLRVLIAALDWEIETTTPQGPGPIKVDNGGEGNRLSEVRGIAKRRLGALEHEVKKVLPPPPTDFDARVLVDGSSIPEDGSHKQLKLNGQQQDYVVLTSEERNKGFVRPYRDAYRHLKCGKITTMARAIAETYAREPHFYSGTFCTTCRGHFSIGEDGDFTWYEMDGREGPKVGV